jgi:hypothetical protein
MGRKINYFIYYLFIYLKCLATVGASCLLVDSKGEDSKTKR